MKPLESNEDDQVIDPEINLSSPATESVCITAMASGMLWNAIEWFPKRTGSSCTSSSNIHTRNIEKPLLGCWIMLEAKSMNIPVYSPYVSI